eukprot:scaffold4543_cov350-Prasinococcus_capsulatus_cf.AAC.2
MGEMSLEGVMPPAPIPSCAGVCPAPSIVAPGPPTPPGPPSPYASGSCSSMASASMDSLRCSSKLPVPKCPSCPSITLLDTPRRSSRCANMAASMRMSTVSSKEHRISGPVSLRLMPCRVMDIRWPR